MANRKDYFTAICDISKAFGTTMGKQALLEMIVDSAIDSMDAKAACLFLSDEEKGYFIPTAQKGLSDNYLHAKPMQARDIVDVLLKQGHLAIKDATTDPRMENREAKKAEGIASILDVPVMVNDRAIGVLALYTAVPRDFNKDEIAFLTALAEQGGMAIERARLLGRIQKNTMLFLELASKINSSLDIKQVIEYLTEETCKALGMKGATIRLVNSETGEQELVAAYGLSQEFLNKGKVSSDKSITAALNGETVVIPDVATDKRLQYPAETVKEGVRSMLCVPIKSREEVIGVLRLFSGTKRDFPEDVIMMVNALAHTGALAIQNASMFLKLQEDKKDLEKDIWSHRSWF
jgi:GAF domain-containing protein